MRTFIVLSLSITSLVAAGVQTIGNQDLPEKESPDQVMAAPAEIQEMKDWVEMALAGRAPQSHREVIKLEVRRQDFNYLHFGQSCMDTPIQIGQRTFQHGLGTHANSDIRVQVPAGTKKFTAWVGMNSTSTLGSAVFIVEADDRELLRTPTFRVNDKGQAIDLPLPEGTRYLSLKTDTTPDGPGWDHTNWADAALVMSDGTVRWLDQDQLSSPWLESQVPFSFKYGGQDSAGLLAKWPRQVETAEQPDRTEYRIRWDDPESKLRVSAVVGMFHQYPAVDWVLNFENLGSQDSPILEKVQSLDIRLNTVNQRDAAILHHVHGDDAGERALIPLKTELGIQQPLRLAPTGGRPSSATAFPFWNIQHGQRGLISAIGWTGQWAATLERRADGLTQVQAGMELLHTILHPGEKIRSPRVLLMAWQNDRQAAHNRFRRLMQFHYMPRQEGRPVPLPLVLQCFDRYYPRTEWKTEAGQVHGVQAAHQMGCDSYWFDAGWFPGGFPNGVGNWFADPNAFPNGLKPISNECHKHNMRFVLWFEPERVAPGSQIAREHPEFLFPGKTDALFRLSDPEARKWLTELLCKRIDEYGVDLYRNDFNIDPLDFWRGNDTPDRQGITEIRYVEGLYAMWDELLARHPGMYIDNCASGGRRIDLEMCMRSVPLWRSDSGCSPGHPDLNQWQYQGLGQYVPLHCVSAWPLNAYDCRSSATGGAVVEWTYLDPDFPMPRARAAMDELRENRKYFYGDFYLLTPTDLTAQAFVVHQFHRPDLDAGLILAFRRAQCDLVGIITPVAAVKADADYQVEFINEDRERTTQQMTGRELADGITLRINTRANSLAVRYAPVSSK